jgi:hypothetical protein
LSLCGVACVATKVFNRVVQSFPVAFNDATEHNINEYTTTTTSPHLKKASLKRRRRRRRTKKKNTTLQKRLNKDVNI